MIESRGENKLINADKITMIDDAFSSYLLDPDEEEFTKKVSSILSAFANQKTFRVTIVKTTPREKEPFFGMRIFPDRGYADGLLKDLTVEEKPSIKKMCDRWRSIPIWEIEIDERAAKGDRVAMSQQIVAQAVTPLVYQAEKRGGAGEEKMDFVIDGLNLILSLAHLPALPASFLKGLAEKAVVAMKQTQAIADTVDKPKTTIVGELKDVK